MKEDYPLGAIADFLEQLPNDEYEHKRIGKMICALEAAEASLARIAQLESILAEAREAINKAAMDTLWDSKAISAETICDKIDRVLSPAKIVAMDAEQENGK